MASRLSESERIGMCNYKIQNGDPLCRKGITGPVWRRCANSTFGVLASPRLRDPGVVPRKNAAVSMHIIQRLSISEYVCLTASSNMLVLLREELTNSLPKMVRSAFCLPIVTP